MCTRATDLRPRRDRGRDSNSPRSERFDCCGAGSLLAYGIVIPVTDTRAIMPSHSERVRRNYPPREQRVEREPDARPTAPMPGRKDESAAEHTDRRRPEPSPARPERQ